jgi:hypothetical protein
MHEVATKKPRGRKPKKLNEKVANDTSSDDNTNTIDSVLAKITQKANKVLDEEKQEEEKLPKKRGRKAKNKIFTERPLVVDEEPKRRGRKPKDKFGVVDKPKTKTKTSVSTEDYIILKLPIKSKDLEQVAFTGDKILTYSDRINPEPDSYMGNFGYKEISHNKPQSESTKPVENIINMSDISNLPSIPDQFENNITKIIKEQPKPVEFSKEDLQRRFENIKERKPGYNYESKQNRQIRLMVQYQESSRRNEWPKNTKIHCFWCCHSFEGIPWAIPIKYSNDIFHVDGNFCSPECAAAYNFEQKDFNMWERYMLLNLLYNKVHHPIYQKLKLAPPRRLLLEYGGNMTINDFRKYCQNYSKDYIINFPPMVSVPTIGEEVNLSEHFRQKIVYMDKDRIEEANKRYHENEKKLMAQNDSLFKCLDKIGNNY